MARTIIVVSGHSRIQWADFVLARNSLNHLNIMTKLPNSYTFDAADSMGHLQSHFVRATIEECQKLRYVSAGKSIVDNLPAKSIRHATWGAQYLQASDPRDRAYAILWTVPYLGMDVLVVDCNKLIETMFTEYTTKLLSIEERKTTFYIVETCAPIRTPHL